MSQTGSHSIRNKKDDVGFLDVVGNLYAKFVAGEDMRTEADVMLDTISMAHEDWKNAESFFQNVTDPDLVDHAIYRVEAARTRYWYLMKQAREMGIRGNWQ